MFTATSLFAPLPALQAREMLDDIQLAGVDVSRRKKKPDRLSDLGMSLNFVELNMVLPNCLGGGGRSEVFYD